MNGNKVIHAAFITAIIIFMMPSVATAQRQMPGQMEISFKANPVIPLGGGVQWSMYGFPGRLYASLNYQRTPKGALWHDMVRMNESGKYINVAFEELGQSDSDRYVYDRMGFISQDVYASAGYLFRILSSRSRSVTLFLGGSFDCGMRFLKGDPSGIRYETAEEEAARDAFRYQGFKEDYNSTRFTTGFSPTAELEFFPFRKVSFSVWCTPRIVIVNPYGRPVDFLAGLGVNFYLIRR